MAVAAGALAKVRTDADLVEVTTGIAVAVAVRV